ncbi:MAG: tRNA pseudouridine(38-40) synthase TruA [Acidimicrobiia bacterium]|nr:tRNA pseudouridine(38-40) synthase TruA [Acidimicrobiia bacterium]NNK91266.1 tRNA pseudouridine(38-40) synthase TruA [Acidimicrobiia bacterium]
MPAVRLDIAYDGSGFRGFARQPDVPTVQGKLEAVIADLTGPVDTVVAGRTDAGVHARHNVVSFSTEAEVDLRRLRRSVNSRLGPAVVVTDASLAPDDFSARFSATGRRYRYRLLTGDHPDPFTAGFTWWVDHELDIEAMTTAAAAFIGEQDFTSLCRKAGDRSMVRHVREASWARDDRVYVYEVEASSFCHQMVRSMVAICVDAGRGRIDPASVPEILGALDRQAGRGVAPPHGLTLWEVAY